MDASWVGCTRPSRVLRGKCKSGWPKRRCDGINGNKRSSHPGFFFDEWHLDVYIHSFGRFLSIFNSFLPHLTDPKEPFLLFHSLYLHPRHRYRLEPLSLSYHEVVSAVAGDVGHSRCGGPRPYRDQGPAFSCSPEGCLDINCEFDIGIQILLLQQQHPIVSQHAGYCCYL